MENVYDQNKPAILKAQINEITEYFIYKKLALNIKKNENKKILNEIADDELKHYEFWKSLSQQDVEPSKWMIFKYYIFSRIFGLTFGLKLMEKGEKNAQVNYNFLGNFIEDAKKIEKDEEEHERKLLNLLHEEKLEYAGSVVLGLNDALVELTGALAGFTFALQNSGIIATAGFITGIAASFSMAASEYLSTKQEKSEKNPLKSAIYTGFTYLITVMILIMPFLWLENVFLSLGITLFNAILIIFLFTFYISVAKDLPFKKHFSEMALISLGVAAFSFGIGILVRQFWSIDV